jgi:carboxyl-terminal processing protease
VPSRNLYILLIVGSLSIACALQAHNLQYGSKVGQAIRMIETNYIEPIDTQTLSHAAIEGVVGKLDTFSEFIPPQRYQEFNSMIEQKFGGIGVQIEGPPTTARLTVVAPIPKTPAFKSGIQAGDVILEIDQRPTAGLSAQDATKLMRGRVGESVELLVQRMDSSERVHLSIQRADIEVDSVYGDRIRTDATWEYFLEEDPRVAYIRIVLFGERTQAEFSAALKEVAANAKALVIDLRFNPGGILPAAVELCDMLVDSGVIVRTQGRRKIFDSDYQATSGVELDSSIPVIVLINQESASASEIMAGCLQDLGRAKIAGSRSYGKGTVQQVFEIENNRTALKFTTARFLRPSFKNIHRTEEMTDQDEWGIHPEPELEMQLDDVQQIYLNRRWQLRGDPRLMTRRDRAPEPAFAADPQLKMVVEYLQSAYPSLGASNWKGGASLSSQPPIEAASKEPASSQPASDAKSSEATSLELAP